MPDQPIPEGVIGVLLCAGRGRRYGGDKLDETLPDGQAVALASLRNLQRAGCRQVVAVLRPEQHELGARLSAHGARTVITEQADRGMGHSLAAAVEAAGPASGWVVALADMPMIQPASMARVLSLLDEGADIAVLTFGGRRGHPVGWSSAWREALLGLEGDQGGRHLLQAHPARIVTQAVDDPGILFDIDTPEAMAALQSSWPAVPPAD